MRACNTDLGLGTLLVLLGGLPLLLIVLVPLWRFGRFLLLWLLLLLVLLLLVRQNSDPSEKPSDSQIHSGCVISSCGFKSTKRVNQKQYGEWTVSEKAIR